MAARRIVEEVMAPGEVLQDCWTLSNFCLAVHGDPLRLLEWLARRRLIKNVYTCPTCNVAASLIRRGNSIDGYRWYCNICKKEKSVRDGSFFSRSKLNLLTLMQLIYCWARDMPQKNCGFEAGLGDQCARTTADWAKFCRDVCEEWLMNHPSEVGDLDEHDQPELVWRVAHKNVDVFSAFLKCISVLERSCNWEVTNARRCWKNGLQMESDCNIVENKNSHKVYIKEEPWAPEETTIAVKFEEPCISSDLQNERVYATSEGSTELKCDTSAYTNNSEMHFKIEIKEELQWLETPSADISCKTENYSHSDVDIQSKNKENASHVDEIVAEEGSRLHRELMCRNSNNDSCSITKTNSEESSCGSYYPNIVEASQLLNISQSQILEEQETDYVLGLAAQDHTMTENCRMPYKCEICGKSFRFLLDLKSHHHEDKKLLRCEISEKSLELNLKDQELTYKEKRPHTCEVCKKSFTKSFNLKQHKLTHGGEKPYKCGICNKSFIDTSNMKRHVLSHEKRSYRCEICYKNFAQPLSLKKHKLAHEGKGPHTCEICKNSFTQAFSLKQHMLTHEGKREHTCDICNKSFTQAYTLKKHKFTHEGKRPYTCEICKNSFVQASLLKYHILSHEKKREHTCDICNKSFTQASTLEKHKLTHDSKRLYSCEICKNSFTQAAHLKRHILTHEGKKPHTCDSCGKSFTRASDMKMHKLTHGGKRQHTCDVCNKSFIRSSSLKDHKLMHEGKKPHKCDICYKSFTLASVLKRHKLIHESIDSEILRVALLKQHS